MNISTVTQWQSAGQLRWLLCDQRVDGTDSVDKGMSHVQLKSEQGGRKAGLTTHNSVQFNAWELFSSRASHLLFSADHK